MAAAAMNTHSVGDMFKMTPVLRKVSAESDAANSAAIRRYVRRIIATATMNTVDKGRKGPTAPMSTEQLPTAAQNYL